MNSCQKKRARKKGDKKKKKSRRSKHDEKTLHVVTVRGQQKKKTLAKHITPLRVRKKSQCEFIPSPIPKRLPGTWYITRTRPHKAAETHNPPAQLTPPPPPTPKRLNHTRTRPHEAVENPAPLPLTHLEHQRSLNDTASDTEQTREEPSKETDGRVAQRVRRVPLNVSLPIPVVEPRFQPPPLDKVFPYSTVNNMAFFRGGRG